jgi:hypothetical protein
VLLVLLGVSGAVLGLACSSEPDATAPIVGSAGTPSGGASAGQATGTSGNATAGSSLGGSAPSAGAGATTAGSAGTSNGGQPSAGGNGGSATATSGAGGGGSGGSGGGNGKATGCVGVTSKFCDDFEMQTTGAAPKGDFSVDAKAGSMVVDTSKAYSGTQALHVTSAKPGSQSFLKFTKQFPMNDFHGRAMFYLARIPTAEIHWDLLDALSQNGQHWEIGGMYGKFILVVDPPDHGLTSNTFPTGKWFCLQWQFKYGGAGVDNTFLAKMDGSVLDKGQFTGADAEGKKWDAGTWQNLSIGWTGYGSSDVDLEEWIDDLAIGDAPIACPSAP